MTNSESFNDDFCVQLEYHLTRMLGEIKKGFWCDGVLMPDAEMTTKKRINDNRRIETVAWAGMTGQERYKLMVHFGKYSLRRYAKGKALDECLPDVCDNSLVVDSVNKQMELYLK